MKYDILEEINLLSLILLVLPIVGSSITLVIKHFNSIDLEGKLMTNLQKFKVFASVIILFSLTLFIAVFMSNGEIELLESGNLFLDIVSMTIVFLIVSTLLFMSTYLPYMLLSIKREFYIYLDESNGTEEWRIIKRTEKKELLIKSDNGKYRILNDWSNKSIEATYPKDIGRFKSHLYDGNKIEGIKNGVLLSVLFIVICVSLYYFVYELWLVFGPFVALLGIATILIFVKTKIEYKMALEKI